MKITVLDSGFVTGDFLKPVAYAGEVNSKKLDIVHPLFKDCYYQIYVRKGDGLYTLGIQDGVATIPPSLTATAQKLSCQFVAMSTPESITDAETDPFVWYSDEFHLTVAQGMDKAGLSPVPTYETLQDMYKNINAAKAEVENAKSDNEKILIAIQEAIAMAHKVPTIDIEREVKERFREQLDLVASEYYQDFTQDIIAEVLKRVEEQRVLCCTNCNKPSDDLDESDKPIIEDMTKEDLQQMIEDIFNDMLKELKSNTATWYSKRPAYSMSSTSNVATGGR